MIGSRSPKKVAQKHLNQAKLHLIEVCAELEDRKAQKTALEERIARLTEMVAREDAAETAENAVHKGVVPTRSERRESVLRESVA